MDMNAVVGVQNLCLITLDTLRFDVAQAEHARAGTPNLARLLPASGWERRHSPGSFTQAAHAAFFAGFFPTPAQPGQHPRRFAARFEGSETTSPDTWVFDAPDLVTALRRAGYHTCCVGGVGFFNKRGELGNVFPSLFDESHWGPELGVAERSSFENQVERVESVLSSAPTDRNVFLFLNVSALHQPNHFYLPGATNDSLATHAAALRYVDQHVPRLVAALGRRGRWFGIVCSDHGTAYGEDGYRGHRLAHPTVWEVPYAEFQIP